MIRANTLHCFTKNVRNWFGYQRKLHFKGEKLRNKSPLLLKTENIQSPLASSPISPKIYSSSTQIPNIKKEEITIVKKEEPRNLNCAPIFPIDIRPIQRSQFSPFYQQMLYQRKTMMNNVQLINAQYANSMRAMLSANRIIPPFGFNFL